MKSALWSCSLNALSATMTRSSSPFSMAIELSATKPLQKSQSFVIDFFSSSLLLHSIVAFLGRLPRTQLNEDVCRVHLLWTVRISWFLKSFKTRLSLPNHSWTFRTNPGLEYCRGVEASSTSNSWSIRVTTVLLHWARVAFNWLNLEMFRQGLCKIKGSLQCLVKYQSRNKKVTRTDKAFRAVIFLSRRLFALCALISSRTALAHKGIQNTDGVRAFRRVKLSTYIHFQSLCFIESLWSFLKAAFLWPANWTQKLVWPDVGGKLSINIVCTHK